MLGSPEQPFTLDQALVALVTVSKLQTSLFHRQTVSVKTEIKVWMRERERESTNTRGRRGNKSQG